jgi:hypothetical protein
VSCDSAGGGYSSCYAERTKAPDQTKNRRCLIAACSISERGEKERKRNDDGMLAACPSDQKGEQGSCQLPSSIHIARVSELSISLSSRSKNRAGGFSFNDDDNDIF